MKLVDAALKYAQMGFSVIPIRPDKKPYIKWEKYQTMKPTVAEIEEWWNHWPDAMIGIVTGKLSGICVVDQDKYKPEYDEAAALEYFPDNLVTPISVSPRGGLHLYFADQEGLTNNAGAIPGVDYRGEGGYIIAPPSINGSGKSYRWVDGLSLDDCELASLPQDYINIINNNAFNKYKETCNSVTERYETLQDVTDFFNKGRRDSDLFHVANCLIKGGMQESIARIILERLASLCNPPFPQNETQIKIDSALGRARRRERNFQKEVEEWVSVTDGYWSVTECNQALQSVTKEDKTAVRVAIHRLRKQGVIEKHGTKDGCYRLVDTSCEAMNFMEADSKTVNLQLPFNIHDRVLFYPGNLIVVAGTPNAGKTAFLINVIKQNMNRFEIHYFNSEMGGAEFRKRLEKDKSLKLSDWKFKAWERSENFQDVIKPGKGKLNIIDFLEVYEEFYRVSGTLADIHRKLKDALCIIALQKNPGSTTGLGGFRTLEKPRLALAMDTGTLKIIKAKNWATPVNPNGQSIEFKIVNGCELIPQGTWK